jgi:aldehyde dehydrogenase (NAD+)
VLSLDPVIGAIAAGNAVVLKPSEVAPATSSLLAELLPRYVDSTCIKVVEGGVSETTALLELKWDKILYTGAAPIHIHMGSCEAQGPSCFTAHQTYVTMENCRQ